jgi:hypothetical protein
VCRLVWSRKTVPRSSTTRKQPDNLFEDDDQEHQGEPGFGSETFLWARNASSSSPPLFCKRKADRQVGLEIGWDGQGRGPWQPSLELFCYKGFMVGWDDYDMDLGHRFNDRFLVLQETIRPRTTHVQPAIIINPLYPKNKGVG